MIPDQASIWLVLLAFVAALGPLVFFHELGHYLVARWFGIPAETFSIGFGREIFGWTDRQGTRWKVGWLQLGGYVKFVGDMGPASNPAEADSIPPELRARAFQFRPVWQRFLVVLAGPAANFLLAILIFAGFFSLVGAPLSNVVGTVAPGTAAARAGIEPGDRIVAIAGRDTSTFAKIFNTVAIRANERVTISVQRGETTRDVAVVLGSDTFKDSNGQEMERGLLGISPSLDAFEKVPLWKALPMATSYTISLTRSIFDGLVRLVSGAISPKQLGGPIKIAQIAGEGAAAGFLPFVQLVALLSINLGFINLLPVPMLDGGHLVLYSLEAVRRRPLSARALEWAFRGGLALLLALVMFTTINDLGSIGLWDRLQRLIG
ncbi:MAG: M50 family metallopeptidase [Sphingomicrobium sp.]